jgi:predicted Na+-dependent transporter
VALLVGARIEMDARGIALGLVLMVLLPTVLGIIINETSHGKIPAILGPPLAPVAKVCLFLIVAGNTAAAAPSVNLKNPETWIVAGVCLALGILAYLLAKPAARLARLGTDKTVSVVVACGMRNISAGATIAIQFFPPEAALPCLLGIVFQQTLAAIMGKALLGRK